MRNSYTNTPRDIYFMDFVETEIGKIVYTIPTHTKYIMSELGTAYATKLY